MKAEKATAIAPVTNGAVDIIALSQPYRLNITIEGTADLLYHRWNAESVDEKAKAAKGSRAKKSDDVESYVMRDEKGVLAIPGEYFRQCLIHAAKYIQDPRSPRKSAMDLFKAGLIVLTESATTGRREWDYLDRRRVCIQRAGINRTRPALLKGWRVTFLVEVLLPEYISRDILLAACNNAGRLVGIGDFRPTYGRFTVVDVAD